MNKKYIYVNAYSGIAAELKVNDAVALKPTINITGLCQFSWGLAYGFSKLVHPNFCFGVGSHLTRKKMHKNYLKVANNV